MDSSSRPATASEIGRERSLRTGAVVAVVWIFAALPFLLGRMRCPTARLFHVPCPGCGMTRALHLLADGELAASFAMHPLALATALSQAALALATVASALAFGAPWSLLRARWGRAAVAAAIVVAAGDLLLWIARMFGAFGGPVAV